MFGTCGCMGRRRSGRRRNVPRRGRQEEKVLHVIGSVDTPVPRLRKRNNLTPQLRPVDSPHVEFMVSPSAAIIIPIAVFSSDSHHHITHTCPYLNPFF